MLGALLRRSVTNFVGIDSARRLGNGACWWQTGNDWNTPPLIFTLLGTLGSALGTNMLTEFFDYRAA